MNQSILTATLQALLAPAKGLLAMDESTPTSDARFKPLGIPLTPDARRAYRDLIVTTPDLSRYVSGAILADETIHQSTRAGVPFATALAAAGIVPGIKVDAGTHDLPNFPGEKVTDGLDGLADRLAEYARLGARFAKWRAVVNIGPGLPTATALATNAHALARYAALCQAAGLVPIVEPEVIMDGDHSLAACAAATEAALHALFDALVAQRVTLEGILLKPNMVVPGTQSTAPASIEEVADATVAVLRRAVPAAVPGIAFLSGGQAAAEATARLNAMHVRHGASLPWALTFSFARAIQQPALELWRGHDAQVPAAQQALAHRARLNSAARQGQYTPALETQP